MNLIMLSTFFALFALVTVLGFFASRWKSADLSTLDEWGLAGRSFGTVITWFLLGGDLYTAYTFIAMPALVFGIGAYGFFAIPYVILIFPFAFAIFPRLWAVANRHGCVTPADFIRVRYGSRWLALAIALTGIIATMPYIALNLVGIEVVVGALGFPTGGWIGEIPLIVAFVILAAYTYTSGLRAPAMIAIVKDILIYATVIAAVIVIPRQLGGFANIFAAVPAEKLLLTPPQGANLGQFSSYITAVIGSALALFMYPHAVTAMFSAASGNAIRRNMVWMPLYTITLGLLALMGYFALAAGVKDMPEYADMFTRYGSNFAVPALFLHSFPAWFAGVAFATIGIGALVPAAIMSIASANLYTRNVHREFFNANVTPAQETQLAKYVSLVVKFGALFFVLFMPQQYAIQLQLLGGIWMIQTVPAIVGGTFTRWFDHRGLLAGWAIGIGVGTWMAWLQSFTKSTYNLEWFGYIVPGYAAVYALALNLIVSVAGTLLARALGLPKSPDATQPSDFDDIAGSEKDDTRPVPGSIPAIE